MIVSSPLQERHRPSVGSIRIAESPFATGGDKGTALRRRESAGGPDDAQGKWLGFRLGKVWGSSGFLGWWAPAWDKGADASGSVASLPIEHPRLTERKRANLLNARPRLALCGEE